ncbi:MAG: biotin/lipoyl-binding protein, partial [Candidatus Onthomonas sp.]|nr:biotin/lipoyl-binding protein [Candidatus Onthomonas sp.]
MPESGEKRGPLQKRWLVLGGLILLAGIFLIPFIQEGGARVDTSVEVETEPAVTGSIRETAEGAGVVVNAASVTVNAVYGGQFAEVAVENGDLVEPGDLLARYDTEELETQIEALLTELDDLDEQIGQSDQGLTYEIQAEVGGLVKTVNARRGGVTGEGPLVVLSADGLLRVGFVPAEGTALPEDGVVVVRMDER